MISKNKQTIQITLSKDTINKLEKLIASHNDLYDKNYTKSQFIEELINYKFTLNNDELKQRLIKVENQLQQTLNKLERPQQKTLKRDEEFKEIQAEEQTKYLRKQTDKQKQLKTQYQTNPNNNEIQNKLIKLKNAFNYSFKELGAVLNVNYKTLQSYITGRRQPNEKIGNELLTKLNQFIDE